MKIPQLRTLQQLIAIVLAGLPFVHDGPYLEAEQNRRLSIPRFTDEAIRAAREVKVPEGFKADLFAAEPMLSNPLAFCIDDWGRVWVAEAGRYGGTPPRPQDDLASRTVQDRIAKHKRDHRNWKRFTTTQERIRLIEDLDADGRADRSTVFADGFNRIEDGLAAGILARGKDVWFTCIPNFWHLRDINGDGRADTRGPYSSGYGVHTGYLGHDLHGPLFHVDGRIYFTCGDRGFNVVNLEGERLAYPNTGAVLRCNLDGSNLEVFHHGLRNPQDIACDDYGNLFTGDNNADSGDPSRLIYCVEGGDSGWRSGYQFMYHKSYHLGPWNSERIWQRAFEGNIHRPLQRTGWKVSASHNNFAAYLAIDNSIVSRYDSKVPLMPGMWFQVEFPEPLVVSSFSFNSALSINDYPRGYQIIVSDDGKKWSKPLAQGKGSRGILRIDFPPRRMRFMRITQTGSAKANYWSIHDLRAEGITPKLRHQNYSIIPAVEWLANGPAGAAFYPGTGLNDSFRDTMFLCDYRYQSAQTHIFSFKFEPVGAGFKLSNLSAFATNVLSSDINFGFDGLYVSTWPFTGERPPDKGRLIRIYDPKTEKSPLFLETREILRRGMLDRKLDELAELLRHADRRVRMAAQFDLAERTDGGASTLARVATKSDHQLARLHAIWGLGMYSRRDRSVLNPILQLLDDEDFQVRAQAAKVLGEHRFRESIQKMLPLLTDENPRVRFFAAIAVGKFGNLRAVEPLLQLLRENDNADPYLRHAGIMGLWGLGRPETLLPYAEDESSAVRMGVLLALRRFKDARIGRFLDDSEQSVVLEAARAINDVPIPDSFPALAGLIQRYPAGDDPSAEITTQFLCEYWKEIHGGIAGLRKSPKFPKKPDITEGTSVCETRMDWMDRYGARIQGVLRPPQTGDYTFWMSSDDVGELWLSADSTPGKLKLIARVSGWSAPYQWNKFPEQISIPVRLEKGRKYYMEAYVVEGGGGDHLEVGWQLPDGALDRPIGYGGDRKSLNDLGPDDPVLRRVLNANFRLGRPEQAKALVEFAASQGNPERWRLEALNMLVDWLKPPPTGRLTGLWRPLPERDASEVKDILTPRLLSILEKSIGKTRPVVIRIASMLGVNVNHGILAGWANSRAQSIETRLESLRFLHARKDKSLSSCLEIALQDGDGRLRLEARKLLSDTNPVRAAELFHESVVMDPVPEQQQALAGLATLKHKRADDILNGWMNLLAAGQVELPIQLDLIEAASKRSTDVLKAQLRRYQRKLPREDRLAPYWHALEGGNRDRGSEIFSGHPKAQCMKCHKTNERGGSVGPDLTKAGSRLSRTLILESLLYPDAKIAMGFETVLIRTKDEVLISGFLQAKDKNKVTLMTTNGRAVSIDKKEIEVYKKDRSPMPSMAEALTVRELRDLVEYLANLK